MKNNKTLIILILAFVVLLGGAYMLILHTMQKELQDGAIPTTITQKQITLSCSEPEA